MDEIRSAMEDHLDQMADLVQKLSAELRSGMRPAYDHFIGFFHAIDWKEPWLICLMAFHVLFLLVAIISRKNTNFQMGLFLFALAGVYFAENLNHVLRKNWQSFAGQNYFDPHGLFLSVLWSGPLIVIAILILVNNLFNLCYTMVKWKRAELRHRARLARDKKE
ncbi:transmembrane protein 18 [Impatiens glandulifera]|uniref:transmembrane protein 18 n=1 Tax=Impatiens glandulifera TaxID=253017 RepID=UPI001FB11F84|nr:transmembrane protein 18 [Impatiens glandulifera]